MQRRSNHAPHRGNGYAESNLLSFDNCRGMPKNGKMVADDGTDLVEPGMVPVEEWRQEPDGSGVATQSRVWGAVGRKR